ILRMRLNSECSAILALLRATQALKVAPLILLVSSMTNRQRNKWLVTALRTGCNGVEALEKLEPGAAEETCRDS
ncbi:hypothetical protein E4U59_004840, partial [Claviceps monticola]